MTIQTTMIQRAQFKGALPKRPRDCHKGQFGHVVIVGSGLNMPGATWLAAQAALRTGAGMVTIATHPLYAAINHLPEVMVVGISSANELTLLLNKATVVVIGPGLGINEWAHQLMEEVLACSLPAVVDASALHLLAQKPLTVKKNYQQKNWILTPHPGEAATLLNTTTALIQGNRIDAVTQLQRQYGGTVVLKGADTLIASHDAPIYQCQAGNSGMASAGMGDTLTGIIAALIAQGVELPMAARLGVWVHATAADWTAHQYGQRGLIASDLMPSLRLLINQLS